MTEPELTPAALAHQIRFALSELRARNGHHLFEEICLHYARSRINPVILPATGPVGAGGDQGRDFESFPTHSTPAVGLARGGDGRILIFACTLEVWPRLPSKIKSDITKITSGSPVDAIYMFCGENVPKGHRAKLIEWAQVNHNVELTIIDRRALGLHLTDADLRWISHQYLEVGGGRLSTGIGQSQQAISYSLPRAVSRLIGRVDEVSQAQQILAPGVGDPSGAEGPVLVVTGAAGIGKTALAVHVARRLSARFPDGQLFIDLSGEDAPGVVDILLHALEPEALKIHTSTVTRLARLRSLLGQRKILIVLDNVQSESTLQHLLAIDGAFGVLCTSRSRLTGLVMSGAELLELGPLTESGTAELASQLTGARPLLTEQVHHLAKHCGGLPLAILIAASRIARRPSLDIAEYLRELGDVEHGLEALSAGEVSMAAILDESHRSLSVDQARIMVVLGALPPGPQPIDVIMAAAASDFDSITPDAMRELRQRLDELFELNLVEQPHTDRYRLHDVVYRFARSKARLLEPAQHERLLTHSCLMYAARFHENVRAIGFIDAEGLVPAESNAPALANLDADLRGCLPIIQWAHDAVLWAPMMTLVCAITPALNHLSRWDDIRKVYTCVQAAGEQTPNSQWLSIALHNLAISASRQGDTDSAEDLFRRSGQVAHDAGDLFMKCASAMAFGYMLYQLGMPIDAISVIRDCLPAWKAIGDDVQLARCLSGLGKAHLAAGQWKTSERYLRNSRAVSMRSRDGRSLRTEVNIDLATILRQTGRPKEARSFQDRLASVT